MNIKGDNEVIDDANENSQIAAKKKKKKKLPIKIEIDIDIKRKLEENFEKNLDALNEKNRIIEYA